MFPRMVVACRIAHVFFLMAIVHEGASCLPRSAMFHPPMPGLRLRGGASEGSALPWRGWIEKSTRLQGTEVFPGAFEIFCDEIVAVGTMPLEQAAGMLEGLMQGIEGACNDCIETYRRPLRVGNHDLLPGGERGLFVVIQGLGEDQLRNVSAMVCSILSCSSSSSSSSSDSNRPTSEGNLGAGGLPAASTNVNWMHTTAGDDVSSCLSRLTTTIANVNVE